MRILITNDDGIGASGLTALVKWAQKLGEVVVAAPKYEQSAKSHGIEIHKAFEVKKVSLVPGVTAYAVDSTPADCVRFAVLGLKEHFDLVISGINRGLNIGADIMYSGTVSAVLEGANLGIKGLAFSTDPKTYDTAIRHIDRIYDYIVRHELLSVNDCYNVNIPVGAGEFRITRQGGPYYSDDFVLQEGDMCLPMGKCVYEDNGDLSLDTNAAMHGYISIMPLTVEKTNLEVYEQLRGMEFSLYSGV